MPRLAKRLGQLLIWCAAAAFAGGTAIAQSAEEYMDEAEHEINVGDYMSAVNSLDKACNGGIIDACKRVGDMHYNGTGIPKNPAKSASYYRRACDNDLLASCLNAGHQYFTGIGVAKDGNAAAWYFQRGCDGGVGEACYNLATAYATGMGVAQNMAKAKIYLKRGCNAQVERSCQALKNITVPDDPRLTGSPSALFDLGKAANERKDPAQALLLFEGACDAGLGKACVSLGLMYRAGRAAIALERDDVKATQFFQRACDISPNDGCVDLGTAYALGHGIAKDESRGFSIQYRACRAGNAAGCNLVGMSYLRGTGVAKNLTKAIILFKQECEKNNGLACDNLAYAKKQPAPPRPQPCTETNVTSFETCSAIESAIEEWDVAHSG